MSTNYNGRIFTIGDTIYFSKFGTKIDGGYASASGTKGTCYGKVTALYSGTYAFPIIIGGTITAGTGGSFTTAAVKPLDCSKGYQVMVIYDKNDGSGTVSSQTGYVGASLTGTMSRAGYQFGGWYTAYSGGSKVTTIPANETRYYAHWNGNTWYVKFNGNGNTGGSTAQQTHTYGSTKALTANGFTRTGYHFNNWNRSSDGSGTSYANKASVTNLTTTNKGTVNLYAQWTPNTYSVKFNGNGATSGSMSNEPFTYGSYKNLTSNAFSKGAGWKFAGWNTKADGTGTSYTNGQSVRNLTSTNGGIVNLYAQWELQYLAPTITNITAIRTDQNGTAQDDGQYLTVTCTCKANTTISSTNKISNVTVKTKENTESSWTQMTSVSPNVATYNLTETSPSADFDTNKTYDVLIEVTDTTGAGFGVTAPQAKAQTFLSKAFFTMDFAVGGEGIGIGMPAPASGLDIGLPTTFYNNAYTSSVRPYDGETGTWLRVKVTGAPNGDTGVLLGVSTNTDNRGVYLPTKGSDTDHWLIREYWGGGNPRIEIGDASNTAGVYLMGHNSGIGTLISDNGTATLANTTSLTKIVDCGTLPIGSWIVFGMVQFSSNSTGTRAARFYVNGTGSGVGYVAEAAGSGTRALSFSSPYRVTSSGGATIEIYARQNSGASMTVTWYYRAIRIA